MENGNSARHEPTAAETATKSLTAADIIYKRLLDFDPSLPALSLRPEHTGKHRKNEQIKSLPRSVRRKFVRLVEDFIDKDPRLAMSIIAMYDAGLRSAEAAAVWIDVILSYQDTDCIFVRYQIKNGRRCAVLKTSNSYRVVPFSAWGKEMLHRCRKQLPDDPNDVQYWGCDPRHLSSTIRKMLIEAGLSTDYLREANASMREKPDYDDSRRPIYDLSAYILRRDWASRARNICGFSSLEIDYCLGHKIHIAKKKREDFRLTSSLARLAVKLERHIHNPKISAHPCYTPYSLQHSTELDIEPFDIIRIRNSSNECICATLDIEAVLNCEGITILAPSNSALSNQKKRSIATHCTRSTPLIIGKSFIKEDDMYEETIIQRMG